MNGTEPAKTLPTYEESYQLFHERVLAYVRNWNNEYAEDITQEVFFNAWRAYPRLNADSNVLHWLIFLAKNTIYNYHRLRKTRSLGLSLETILDEAGDIFAGEESIEDAFKEQLPEHLSTLLLSLQPQQREALLLTAEGYSYEEIAKRQSSTIGTTCSRMSRARQHAKQALAKQDYSKSYL